MCECACSVHRHKTQECERKIERKKKITNEAENIVCVYCVCVSYTIGSVCALLMRVCIGNIGIYTHQISVRVFLYEPTANLFRRLFCVFLFVFVLLFFFNKMMIIIIIADSHTGYLCVYVMCVRASVSLFLSHTFCCYLCPFIVSYSSKLFTSMDYIFVSFRCATCFSWDPVLINFIHFMVSCVL